MKKILLSTIVISSLAFSADINNVVIMKKPAVKKEVNLDIKKIEEQRAASTVNTEVKNGSAEVKKDVKKDVKSGENDTFGNKVKGYYNNAVTYTKEATKDIPGTASKAADSSFKYIKEKGSEGVAATGAYVKNWFKSTWEETKKKRAADKAARAAGTNAEKK